jgi:aryl-alcohol dehydrogenase-like predicted oxidoreductase/predicted kinase
MRLSTAADRDERRAIAVLHAAFDAGVDIVDTADAYCHDDADIGHNERLIARALREWRGDPAAIRVATKGGLTRPDGRWAADGREAALAAACRASLRALGIERIPLYQLHAVDPRVPLSTSVRALASLQREGLIESIGLCNVTVGQIEEARTIVEIASVQVEVSLWRDDAVLAGTIEHCERHRIQLLAHRPLGGPERRRRIVADPLLVELAATHRATPFEIALAALETLCPVIVPLPGPTRTETASSLGRVRRIAFREDELARLAERFPTLRAGRYKATSVAAAGAPADGEIVMIMGLPGAGKSTIAARLVGEGYARINRDDIGGSLRQLLPVLDRLVDSGQRRLVLDNTYVSRKARGAVIQAARQRGLAVRGVWLSTSLDDAQVNAASRLVSRYGRLLEPEELLRAARTDPGAFAPVVQFRYQRELEPPDLAEGFSSLEVETFERRRDPSCANRAVIVWCDGLLFRSRSGRRVPASPSDVDVFPERGAVLRLYEAEGWKVLGMSWLPEVSGSSMSAADADAILAAVRDALGVGIDIQYCPHPAGPPVCWCRKPLPGLGVTSVHRYRLDPARCIYVGSGPQDPAFARKLGFQYYDADDFFSHTTLCP